MRGKCIYLNYLNRVKLLLTFEIKDQSVDIDVVWLGPITTFLVDSSFYRPR